MRSTIVFFFLMKFGNQRLLSTGVHGKNITPWNLLYVLYVRVRREIHYKRNERNSHTN